MNDQAHWTKEELREVHDRPLLELIAWASSVTRKHHPPNQIQVCSLISIKTGGCPEDCKYCPQSARYRTNVSPTALMQEEEALQLARNAIAQGATRVCLGAAWKSVRDGAAFDRVLRIIRQIADLGVEVCCTLGLLTGPQAHKLKEAGLPAAQKNLRNS